jgi:uncharacterized membrane protein YphA (DoxX/SURF4 family)
MDWMNIGLWGAQAILAVMFLMAGTMKAFQYERAKASLPWVKDLSKGLVTFIGIAELLGGLGLLLPAIAGFLPWLTPLAAVGISVVMLLAAAFHARRSEHQGIAFNLVLLALAVFVAYGRWFVRPL